MSRNEMRSPEKPSLYDTYDKDNGLQGPTVDNGWKSCLHVRFSEQADKHPDSIAIISETEEYTYKDVEDFSNAIAHRIVEHTDGQKAFVGICMERSAQLIVGLIGILKAGCAYVPLDPTYPKDRINDMLLDIQASVVVTTSGFKHIFRDHDLFTLCVEDTVHSKNYRPPVLKNVGPESLAYVIFTSGSTGKPKGVCCYHGSVLNLLLDFQDRQPIGHGDICSWWTSLNFDVSVYEIFSPLTEGATLIVVPDSVRPDGSDLMEWLYNNNVTSAYLPPFMVSDLEIWTRKNPDKSPLRRLLVGVEPIPEKTLLAIDNAVPSIHIINGYGPTETTICATLYSINQANAIHENTPIGKPVQNTILRILDEDGNVVPPGETGELFIGGVGLAREYLNRPDLTQARFLKDHLSQDPQARLYKTGDLVRLLDDGDLEFLGRRDFQVKIRGFRVELGEIETLIRRLQPIRETVVILREDEPGRQILVAYFVCREGQSLPIRSIRDHLKKYLPDYMIPSAFIAIDTIPSTPNGKTDRAALPIPQAEHVIHSSDDEFQKPANQTESTLLGFFRDLLKIESVGVSDNFFELGGHSLLAAQLVSRIRDEFCIAICLQDIFQAPTIRRLSKTVQSLASTQAESSSIPLKCSPQLTEYPISYSQMRIWYLDQLEPNTPAYNICLCYKLLGPLDVNALNQSLNLIAQRHQSLRTTFEKREPHPVQIINPLEKFSIELLDVSGIPVSERASEARALYNKEIHRGFDLSKGPLFRFILIKLDSEEHILVFTIHHIISDGWSMGIIVKDLMSLYSAIVSEKPISLPTQPFEYRDYALAQTEWMETDACNAQLSYWKQKFKTIPDPLELPTDFPRPAIQSYRGSSQTIVFDADLVKQLKRVGAKENTTLFMVLLAGLKALLHRYTSQPDLCIGTFVANRNRQEIENIVGFFVNTVAIRTEIHDDPTIADLIVRVRDNSLGAFANQDPPFERLLEEIKPERSLSRTPIFQVMMVLQNIPLPALELPNLRCAPVELETFRSNFDMTLWMYEIGDQLKIVFEYSIDLFKESTISRMLEHFRNLLKQACLNPQCRLSELEILGEDERKTLLADWSGDIPLVDICEKTVVDIFEDVAGTFDSKTAALDLHGDSHIPVELSYSDLNRKSNQLARGLKSRGVGPETCVAILLEPFRFMIIGILGILKSQAAYVPLDSKYPQKRIESILRDTQAPLVITDQANEETVQSLIENSTLSNKPEIICLDRDWDNFSQFSSDNIIEKPTGSNAAYVIYTSGSTGAPKGVIIEHGALSAFVKSAVKLYGFSASDRIQQFASPSFDASVEEIFCALCSGATLVLKSQTELQSISTLAGEWSDSQITILDLPTAFWHQLTTALEEKSILLPETLRTVIIGGEQPSV
ncbi:MAG: amino acid adenylation domain-containing protein, partial [Desulfomonilaceae bacterium]